MGTPGSGYGHPSAQKNQMVPPPPSNTAPAAGGAAQAAVPASALDQPAQPAKIELTSGKLTIQADNSSLTAILNQLSTSAGMAIDGLNKDERIFGTYGPGEPREILSALLEGSGYNVVMFGHTNSGTPSQLTLSLRQTTAAGADNAQRNVQRPPEEEDEEPAPTQYEDAAPPNSQQPAPGTQTNPQGNGVKTPQQMLQELQTIRQQQQQQQQPQNPQ